MQHIWYYYLICFNENSHLHVIFKSIETILKKVLKFQDAEILELFNLFLVICIIYHIKEGVNNGTVHN